MEFHGGDSIQSFHLFQIRTLFHRLWSSFNGPNPGWQQAKSSTTLPSTPIHLLYPPLVYSLSRYLDHRHRKRIPLRRAKEEGRSFWSSEMTKCRRFFHPSFYPDQSSRHNTVPRDTSTFTPEIVDGGWKNCLKLIAMQPTPFWPEFSRGRLHRRDSDGENSSQLESHRDLQNFIDIFIGSHAEGRNPRP